MNQPFEELVELMIQWLADEGSDLPPPTGGLVSYKKKKISTYFNMQDIIFKTLVS